MNITRGRRGQRGQRVLCGLAAGVTLTAAVTMSGCTHAVVEPAAATVEPQTLVSSAEADQLITYNTEDLAFLQQMIPHHQQAVQMSAEMTAAAGIDPAVVQLADRISETQQAEVEQMQSLLEGWGDPAVADDQEREAVEDGTLTAAEMRALRDAEGATAQMLYLRGMIDHHRGAIMISSEVLRSGTNDDVRSLAQTIVATQQEELVAMQKLLISV